MTIIIGYILGTYLGPIVVIGLMLYGIYYLIANFPEIFSSFIDSLPAISAWLIHAGLLYINYVWDWLRTYDFVSFRTIIILISFIIIKKCVTMFIRFIKATIRFVQRTHQRINNFIVRYKKSELAEIIRERRFY